MEDNRASIFAREGQEFPGATYKEVVLEPASFVQIRALPGGPAPEEMRRALEERRTAHARRISDHRQREEKIRVRLRELDAVGASSREDR